MLRDLLEQPGLYELKSRLLSFGRRSVRDYLRRTVPLRDDARILDVGCGPGRHAETFTGRYVGVDLNPSFVSYASLKSHGRHGHFSRMDGAVLAFPEGVFDLVFCVGLLHHLPDTHVARVVEEMKRCTAPGGAACIVEAVMPVFPNFPGQILFVLDRGRHQRNLAELSALLSAHSFQCATPEIPRSFPYQRACFRWECPLR